MVLQKEK